MNKRYKILLVCSSGMSTSLLVKEMQKAAEEEKYPADISFASVTDIDNALQQADAVLVGPQIRHRYENIKSTADELGIPAALIPQQIYGVMDGKAALKIVKDFFTTTM